MKPYGVMADLHAHNWQAFSSVNKDGINTRLVDILHELDRCCQKVLEAGGNWVVIAGDVFHTRGSIVPSVFNPVKARLEHWVRQGIRFDIIPGNHDLESAESMTLTSAVTALGAHDIMVRNCLAHISWSTGCVVLVPWHTDPQKVYDRLALYTEPGAIAFIHAGINEVLPGMPPKGLDPDGLKALGYKHIFAGHYHNHKDLGGGVYSIGAPVHHTWGDVGLKAGFQIVSDEEVRWFASHAPSFVEIKGALDEDELPFIVDGHFVKANLGMATPAEIAASRKLLMEMGAKGVLIQAAPKTPGMRVGAVKASLDTLDLAVAEWIKGAGMSDEVVEASHKLLAEVRS